MINKKTIWASVVYLRKFKELSKAVQLVAIAKLKKFNKYLNKRHVALSMAAEIFDHFNSADFAHKRYTVVLITSERSCCGKLNNEIILVAKDAIEGYIDSRKQVRIISIGWKGRSRLFSKYRYEFVKNVTEADNVSLFLSYVITLCIFDTDFDKCVIYFSKFYTLFEQVAAYYEFSSYAIFFDYIYNNRKENLFYELLVSNCLLSVRNFYYYYVCLVVLDSLEEHKYSELGCRAFSMEMAHRNALELIQEKVLIYNKARQAGITTDLLEVVAGSIYTV